MLKNAESEDSNLFIFSDAPKDDRSSEKVNQVRNYIKTISGFKSITIKEQTQNQGLAKSIIDGVTEIVNKFGKIIVLEDDIETSPYFLKYMNNALIFYENEKRIWSITGFTYPIKNKYLPDAFCFFAMSCWGWGTWANRWEHYDKNPDKYISLLTKKNKNRFDYYGTTKMYSQITANKTGELNTWAIFWYAEQYINNGFQIMPAKPLSKNIGMDNSGVHCKKTSVYDYSLNENDLEIDFKNIPVEENSLATNLICEWFRKQKPSIIVRAKNIIKRIICKIFSKKIIVKLKLLIKTCVLILL